MKTTLKIAVIAMMGMSLGVSAQEVISLEGANDPNFVNKKGNVGIGTLNPNFKLHINSPDNQLMRFTSTNGTWMDFESTNAPEGNRIWSIGHRGTSGLFGIYQRDGTNQYRLVINNKGNVGIGTLTTGNHRLAVEGSIGAREIKVEASGWSDFVFYDNYNLPTLTEVESYIKEKGHLKDIPSAKEVEENGIYLGEMDSKLLQKIEELTLYTIEQEKKLKSQEKQFDKQQKEIEELKKQNSRIKDLEILVQKLLKDKN